MNVKIESDVPPPTSAKKTRTKKADTIVNSAKKLIDAITFVKPKTVKPIEIYERNVLFCGGHVISYCNDILIAHPIDEEFYACPEIKLLLTALAHVKSNVSFTLTDVLTVTSGVYRASVPCRRPQDYPALPAPDPDPMPVTSTLQRALREVLPACDTSRSDYPSVLIQGQTVVATCGHTLIESWHGLPLPELRIPIRVAELVAKSKLPLTGIAHSDSSVTFYFENGALIRTELVETAFPNYEHLFEIPNMTTVQIPDNLFTGLKAVEMFSVNQHVYFHNGSLKSSNSDGLEAASYEIPYLSDNIAFSADSMKRAQHIFKNVHFSIERKCAVMMTDISRAIISSVDISVASGEYIVEKKSGTDEDDIPF